MSVEVVGTAAVGGAAIILLAATFISTICKILLASADERKRRCSVDGVMADLFLPSKTWPGNDNNMMIVPWMFDCGATTALTDDDVIMMEQAEGAFLTIELVSEGRYTATFPVSLGEAGEADINLSSTSSLMRMEDGVEEEEGGGGGQDIQLSDALLTAVTISLIYIMPDNTMLSFPLLA